MKKCPYCAEEIQDEAIKCKHCLSDLTKRQQLIKKLSSNNENMIEEEDLLNAEKVKLLLDQNPQLINGKDSLGWTNLHRAASIGQLTIVELLISKGSEVDSINGAGVTPLLVAAGKGHRDIVEFLISKGAAVNAESLPCGTPLHSAASKGNMEVVELLISKGAIVNFNDMFENTPLKLALKNGHNEVVAILNQHGGTDLIPPYHWRPLEFAMDSIRSIVGSKEPDMLTIINRRYNNLKLVFNFRSIEYCLNKYIFAELDHDAPGDRGLGRITSEIPRLGAYFRKRLSRLSSKEVEELYSLIQHHILRAYLVHAIFAYNHFIMAKITNTEDLYKAWIPKIYLYFQTPEDLREILFVCADSSREALKYFLKNHRMKGGGFLAGDKTESIIFYYIAAGFLLRVVEMGEMDDESQF